MDALTQAAQEDGDDGSARDAKRRRVVSPDLLHGWRELHSHTESVQRHLARASGTTDGGAQAQVVAAPVFAFVEGALVTALREGHWLLLDEINLAPVETLERLASIIEVRPHPGTAAPAPHCACVRDTFEPGGATCASPGRVFSRRASGSPLTAA